LKKDKKLQEQYKAVRKKLDEDPAPKHIYTGNPEVDKTLNEQSVKFRKEALDRCIGEHKPETKEIDFFR